MPGLVFGPLALAYGVLAWCFAANREGKYFRLIVPSREEMNRLWRLVGSIFILIGAIVLALTLGAASNRTPSYELLSHHSQSGAESLPYWALDWR